MCTLFDPWNVENCVLNTQSPLLYAQLISSGVDSSYVWLMDSRCMKPGFMSIRATFDISTWPSLKTALHWTVVVLKLDGTLVIFSAPKPFPMELNCAFTFCRLRSLSRLPLISHSMVSSLLSLLCNGKQLNEILPPGLARRWVCGKTPTIPGTETKHMGWLKQ